jgi:hypothetical protein
MLPGKLLNKELYKNSLSTRIEDVYEIVEAIQNEKSKRKKVSTPD